MQQEETRLRINGMTFLQFTREVRGYNFIKPMHGVIPRYILWRKGYNPNDLIYGKTGLRRTEWEQGY